MDSTDIGHFKPRKQTHSEINYVKRLSIVQLLTLHYSSQYKFISVANRSPIYTKLLIRIGYNEGLANLDSIPD